MSTNETAATRSPHASRPLRPVERLVVVADEAATLNFATSALIAGRIETAELRRALDTLPMRHPLLGAACDGTRFAFGGAAPIELVESNGPVESVDAVFEAELRHRRWASEGPRVRCVLIRHEAELATIVLAFHHLVSDGSSGVLAMRDLLRALASVDAPIEPIPSPGQDVFFPEGRGGAADMVRSLAYQGRQGRKPKPIRLKSGPLVGPDERAVRIARLRFTRDETNALLRFAKRAGATMHGVLTAAIARSVAEESTRDGLVPMRVMHPVDMRRYLATLPGSRPIGEAIGYYVSSVETDHAVDRAGDFESLAAEITTHVRAAKERGEPFLTGPTAGRLLVLARALLGASTFRSVAEQSLLPASFTITNLGPLEKLGMEPSFGPYRVRSFGFVAAPSIFGSLCASASTFDGELELVLHHVEPRIDAATGARIRERVERALSVLIES